MLVFANKVDITRIIFSSLKIGYQKPSILENSDWENQEVLDTIKLNFY